uniref:Uncharacterized protein n=1 Tax=Heterorhabditis bacteriophora TaxID=37862 RepID=A0A1I7WUJ4_HETBA
MVYMNIYFNSTKTTDIALKFYF